MTPRGDPLEPAAGTLAGSPPRACSDRTLSAIETWERIEPLLSAFGITRMARMTGLDRLGIPVWNAIMPNARSLAISQGKGITDVDAKVSAAMEGLERAIAASPWPRGLWATAEDLAATGKCYHLLHGLTAAGAEELKANDPICWIEGRRLPDHETVYLPLAAVALDTTGPDLGPYWQSSDGLASGNTPLEAQFHGLMERVERDADCLFHFLGPEERASRVIDPQILSDAVLTDLLTRIEAAGFRAMLFDMTSDNRIPVILCHIAPADVTTRRHVGMLEITGGAGAHPDPARAAIRAVTEAAQSRITFISGTRDDIDADDYGKPAADWIRTAFTLPCRSHPLWIAYPGSLQGMLATTLERLLATGAGPVFAVRLSDTALPLAVEKIIAPGLENPPGARLRPFGIRALMKAVSR